MKNASSNPAFLGFRGTIGRRDYFLNFLKALTLLAFSWLSIDCVSPGSSGTPSLLELVLLLPAPLGAVLSLWALLANTLKRVRDVCGSDRRAVLWAPLLLVPFLGLGVQALLFMKPGARP